MKKGFTLVELLAVIVIIGIITLVAVPNIVTTNKKSKENEYLEFKKTIENAAETYVETTPEIKENLPSDGIKVKTLIEVGLLNKGLENPTDNKSIGEVVEENENKYKVIVQRNGNEITYEFRES